MQKSKNYFLLMLFILLTISDGFAASNYNNEAENLNSTINNSQVFKNYLGAAKNLDEKQKPNQFLNDQDVIKANDKVFNELASNQQLKQIFPKVDFDALKAPPSQLDQLMIFVSSSMPLTTLKQFSLDAKKANGVLVLRGLINDSFKETINFVRTLNNQGTRAIIDPNAFTLFDVKQAPEIVVIIDNNNCQLGRCDHTPLFDKISGTITLEYALEEISKRGEFTKKEAARFLNYLRQGGGNG